MHINQKVKYNGHELPELGQLIINAKSKLFGEEAAQCKSPCNAVYTGRTKLGAVSKVLK